MKAVITVIGHDTVGILAKVSTRCAEHNANIIEVTQSVMEDLFAMVMLVDITKISCDFTDLQNTLVELGDQIGMKIHVMHEDVFNAMHRI